MNTSILIDSLKYVSHRFANLGRLSSWIYGSLIDIHYKDTKFQRALDTIDIDIIRHLIYLVQDQMIIERFISNFIDEESHDRIEVIKILYETNFSFRTLDVFEVSCKYEYKYEYTDLSLFLIRRRFVTVTDSLLDIALKYENYEVTKLILISCSAEVIDKCFLQQMMLWSVHGSNYLRFMKLFLKYDINTELIIRHALLSFSSIFVQHVYLRGKITELLKQAIQNDNVYLVEFILVTYRDIDTRTDSFISMSCLRNRSKIATLLLRYDFKTTMIDCDSDPDTRKIYSKYERFYS